MISRFVDALARFECGTDDVLYQTIVGARVLVDTGGASPKNMPRQHLIACLANRFATIPLHEIERATYLVGDFESVTRLLWTAERTRHTPEYIFVGIGVPSPIPDKCATRGYHHFPGDKTKTCVDCGYTPSGLAPDVVVHDIVPEPGPDLPAQWVLQDAIDAADAEFGPERVNPG